MVILEIRSPHYIIYLHFYICFENTHFYIAIFPTFYIWISGLSHKSFDFHDYSIIKFIRKCQLWFHFSLTCFCMHKRTDGTAFAKTNSISDDVRMMMILMAASLHQTNTLSWICTVLALWTIREKLVLTLKN